MRENKKLFLIRERQHASNCINRKKYKRDFQQNYSVRTIAYTSNTFKIFVNDSFDYTIWFLSTK